MKTRKDGSKENDTKTLFKSESAAATVIAAVLLLSIIFTIFAIVRIAYVPEWKNDAEKLHMSEVQSDMTELKTMADTATFYRASNPNLPSDYSYLTSPYTTVRIRMGGGEVPIVSPSRSSGLLTVNKNQCVARLVTVTESGKVNTTTVDCGGVTYSSNNEQYVDQILRYENGGLLLAQGDRSVMRQSPSFAINDATEDYESAAVDGTFNYSASILMVSVTGKSESFSSETDTTLKFAAKKFTSLNIGDDSDRVKSFSYTILTEYPDAWGFYFNETAKDAGLNYGADFNITEGVDSGSTGLSYVTFEFLPTEDKYLENLRVNTSAIEIGSGSGTSTVSTNHTSIRQPPIPGFSFIPTSSGCAPVDIQIVDESQYAKNYSYNFGDGTPAVTGAEPSHRYTTPGTFTITQTVTNRYGAKTATKPITVRHMPIANFTSDVTEGEVPLTVNFNDTSQYATGGITWNFGDGNANETGSTVTHEYITPGTYSVTLTASNGFETNTTTGKIVAQQLPVAWFSASYLKGQAPLNVVFTDYSENAVTWSWNFGDGSVSNAQNPTHIYSQVGTYDATLKVTNEYGQNNMTLQITVTPQAPAASFTYASKNGQKPTEITFTDTSTNSPTSWSWSFGDLTTSNEKNPVHSYAKSGQKTVTLTVGNSGGTTMITKVIKVN